MTEQPVVPAGVIRGTVDLVDTPTARAMLGLPRSSFHYWTARGYLKPAARVNSAFVWHRADVVAFRPVLDGLQLPRRKDAS